MSNNQKPEEELTKECPFNGKWCGDWCPLFSQLTQQANGMVRQTNMCAFVAANAILSNISMAIQQQQKPTPPIHLPGNLRGN